MPKAPEPKEIRDRYSDYKNEWQEIYEEGKTDMRFVAGDPWDPKDRRIREDAGRPCISLDEINQYINQAINNVRQNKRSVQVTPKGEGANDNDAEHRENIIRGIERRSNGQAACLTAFENAVQRSYGFVGITTGYVDEKGFEQEIKFRRFQNPDTVLIDPTYKQANACDIEAAFVTDLLRKEDFKRKYPKAKLTSASESVRDESISKWIRDKYIQIAELWMVQKTKRKLLLIDAQEGATPIFEDEPGAKGAKVLKSRTVEMPTVVQYITNGLEILEEIPWAGTRIPICGCFGKEIFVDDGGGSKRQLISMVRLARDPQMLLAYLTSQEAEEAGQSPRTPFVGGVGQFETDAEAWKMLNKIPRAYIQYDATPDGTGQPLGPPSRPQYEPNFQAYELAKDSARRSIQAAMGISPLPTAAQRDSEKSGVALEKIQDQEAIGAFHFTDNYDLCLENVGFQINELIKPIYDTARHVPITKNDGTHGTLALNGGDEAYEIQGRQEESLATDKGEYGVTISTGPNYQSQREAAAEFVNVLVNNLGKLPIPPQVAQNLLALGIRMRDLGPIGDKIADMLMPPDQQDIPPQAQAAIAQAQGVIQDLQQKIAELSMEKQAKVVETQGKVQIEGMRHKTMIDKQTIDYITKLVIAEISAKSKANDQQAQADVDKELTMLGFHHDQIDRSHDAAHEFAMTTLEHQHEKELSATQLQAAQAQQTTQIAADQQSQAQEQQSNE